ncbi:MAG: S8 family serine peptidase, partial [Bacteroidia bacterium]
MRKLITLTLLLALFAASCQKDDLSNEISSEANFDALFQDIKPLQNTDLIPQSEIDKTIIETLVNEGEYKWVNSTDEHLWSAVNYGDSIASIGYKPANMGDISDIMHTIDVSHVDWMRARHTIIELLVEEERKATNNPGLTKEDVIIEVHETIPVIFARVSGYYSLAKTRRLPQTRYVEPLGYDVRPETVEINVSNKSGGSCPPKNHTKNFNVWDPLRLGCSNEADPNTNYSLVQPNYSIVPWHYKHSRVRIFNAWNHSQGDNITIGMIDSGTSPRQTKLNSQFATGWSTSRSITRVGKFNPWYPIPFTRPDGPNDNCGHGTLMAGCAAGPRNGYSTVGVAYKANLVAVRGADDVFLNSTQERK